MTAFLARRERFGRIGSTNDVVGAWLADGTPEVCLAVADEQAAGRGRAGRAWTAPPGSALLLSVGFRPAWLEPARAWRLAAVVGLAMADAAEEAAGLRDGVIRLKWPNDLVVEEDGADVAGTGSGGGAIRKLGGVLGETQGLGGHDPRAVVGIGVNADWARVDFPADLAASMTSLREAAGGRPVGRDELLDAFLSRLEARVEALRSDRFGVGDWVARQVTTGRLVRLEGHGPEPEEVRAVGVDPASGALLVEDARVQGGERAVFAGDVTRVRLSGTLGASAATGRLGASSTTGAAGGAGAPDASGAAGAPGMGRV